MVIPPRKVWGTLESSTETPWLVKQLETAGRPEEAMETLGDMAFGTSTGELLEKSVVSGFSQGIANKAFRASKLWLKDSSDDKKISRDEANEKYGLFIEGKPVLSFDEDISEEAAKYKRDNKLDELIYNTVSERAIRASKWNYLPMVGGQMFGTIGDPGELTLGFLTGGLASSRYAAFVGRNIKGAKMRTIYRGGVFSTVEAGVGEYPHHKLSDYLGEEYTWKDTTMNLGFSLGLGTLISGGRALAGSYDEIGSVRPEDVMAEVEDQYAVLFGERSNIDHLTADNNQKLLANNSDLVQYQVELAYKNFETINKRKPTTIEQEDIRSDIEIEITQGAREQAQVDIAKNEDQLKHNLTVADDAHSLTVAKEINYDTEANAKASDEALSESLDESLKEHGIEISIDEGIEIDPVEVKLKKDKSTEGGAKASKTEEVDHTLDEAVEAYKTSVAAINASRTIFPRVDIELMPDDVIGAVEPGTRGFYDPKTDKVYMNPNEVLTPEIAADTILHEILTHKGLKSIYKKDKDFKALMDYAYKQHKTDIDAYKVEKEHLYNAQFDDIHILTEEWIANKYASRGAVDPGFRKTFKADIKRMMGKADIGSYDFLDSVIFKSSLNMRSRSLESLITNSINTEKYTPDELKVKEDISINKKILEAESKVDILKEFESGVKREFGLASLELEAMTKSYDAKAKALQKEIDELEIKAEGMSKAKARGIESRIKRERKLREAEAVEIKAKARGIYDARARGVESRIKADIKIKEAEAKRIDAKVKEFDAKVSDALKKGYAEQRGKISANRTKAKAVEDKASDALKKGYAETRGTISAAKFKEHKARINELMFGKDADLKGLSELQKLAKKYADHNAVEAYINKRIKQFENQEAVRKLKEGLDEQKTEKLSFEQAMKNLAKMEQEANLHQKQLDVLRAEEAKIEASRSNRARKKTLSEYHKADSDNETNASLDELGLSHLRFAKADPAVAKKQIRHARTKLKNIKEAYAKKVLDSAIEKTDNVKGIKDTIKIKLKVGNVTHKYTLPVTKLLDAKKNIDVLNRIITDMADLSDVDRIPYLNNLINDIVYNEARFIEHKHSATLQGGLRKAKQENFFKVEDNIKELYASYKGVVYKKSLSSDAKKVREIVQGLWKGALREQNLEGGRSAFFKGHVIPRNYVPKRMQEFFTGKKTMGDRKMLSDTDKTKMQGQFVDWYLGRGEYEVSYERLDYAAMYPDGRPDEDTVIRTLKGMFDDIFQEKSSQKEGAGSNIAARSAGGERKIHFTKWEDDYFHDKTFGSEDTLAAIYQQIETVSTRTALLKNLGTNPEYMIRNRIIPGMKDMLLDLSDMKNVYEKLADPLVNSLKIIDRSAAVQKSVNISKILSNLRAIANITHMGALIFSSASDPAFRGLALRNLDVDEQDVIKSYFGVGLSKRDEMGKWILGKDDEFGLVNNLAQSDAQATASLLGRFDVENIGMSSAIAKSQHMAFNVNLMNYWNKHMREGFIVGAVKRMGANSTYSLADLKSMPRAGMLVKAFEKSGIDEVEWEIIRGQAKHFDSKTLKVTPANNRKVDVALSADMIQQMDRSIIAKHLKKDINSREVEQFANNLTNKYGSLLKNQMDIGVLTPGVRESKISGWGNTEGTIMNQIAKTAMQYKTFPIAMATKILGPQWGNVRTNGIKAGGGIALLGTIGVATGIQVVSMQAREILSGKTARPWDGRLLWDAFVKSGAGSIAVDFMRDYENIKLQDLVGGPVGSLGLDTLGLISQAYKSTFNDDPYSDAGIKAAKIAKHWFPLAGHPAVKASVVDPAFNIAADWLSPDTLRRSEQWYNNRGQEFWMNSPTGDNIPFSVEEILGLYGE
jgi:hypothetical protein